MRKIGPDGTLLDPDAYVFGNEIGGRVKSVRAAWQTACEKAGLKGVHLADLRHEAASRFGDAGMAISFVSTMLGHTNLTTTSRYLNIHRRGLHLAMAQYEKVRELAKSLQNSPAEGAQRGSTPAPSLDEASTEKPLIS